MKNKFEYILLSILLGLSVLLGLSFWLNTMYSFNIFCHSHWNELARLQTSQTPISTGFYISFIVAIFIFLSGTFMIYRPIIKKIRIKITKSEPQSISTEEPKEEKKQIVSEQPTVIPNRPPHLNLPKNIAHIAEQKHLQNEQKMAAKDNSKQENPYNSVVSDIFTENKYVVKPNPTISGFVPNLFAIGNNEVVWIGGIDCDLQKMMDAIQKLQSVFQETLEDIPININAFILDTLNKYDSTGSVLIFKSIDDLKQFISEHQADKISEEEKDNFDSYSEYIDTVIRYIKNA